MLLQATRSPVSAIVPAPSTPVTARGERLVDDERREESRREQVDGSVEARRQPSSAEQGRTGRLERDRAAADDDHREPDAAHRRLARPSRHAEAAAITGTPAGVSGISARAIAPPATAAATER